MTKTQLENKIQDLEFWKEQQIKMWLPVLEYMQKHPELKAGDSISEHTLKFIKQRDDFKKFCEELKELAKP